MNFDPSNLPEGALSVKKNKSGIRIRYKTGTVFYRSKATQEQVLAHPYPHEEIEILTKQGLIVAVRDIKQKLYNYWTKNFTVVSLKEFLSAFGLPKTGKKHDLVMQLVNKDYNSAIEMHNRIEEARTKAKAAAQRAAEEEEASHQDLMNMTQRMRESNKDLNLFEGTDL